MREHARSFADPARDRARARTHTHTHLDKGEGGFEGFRQIAIADHDVCEIGRIVKDGFVEVQSLNI